MSQFLELQRSRLEEIDALRNATFKRFKKNPDLIPKEIRQKDDILSGKKSKSFKQTALQSHEICVFDQHLKQNMSRLKYISKDIIRESLQKITDPKNDFEYFDSLYEQFKSRHDSMVPERDVKAMYSMYSSAPMREVQTTKKGKLRAKRKHILSEQAAASLNTNTLFTDEEMYGKYLDLRSFYDSYKRLTQSEVSYIGYLKVFDKVPYSGIKDVSEYEKYSEELAQYLLKFVERSDALLDIQRIKDDISDAFSTGQTDGKPDEQGQVYCRACDKLFTKESVYKGHLEGKKHKNNMKKGDKEVPEVKANEHQIQHLSSYLKTKIQDTISNVERQEGMTERERWLEKLELAEQDSEYTTADSNSSEEGNEESSGDEDNALFKDLPTGADGAPIPFWLYKLQGLHHSYNCEICGNVTYKGRLNFEKHFSSAKHQNGLKMLGIASEKAPLFLNIATIDEAAELWRNITKDGSKQEDADDDMEVEDDEGNVMTKRDYLQLKKQGII